MNMLLVQMTVEDLVLIIKATIKEELQGVLPACGSEEDTIGIKEVSRITKLTIPTIYSKVSKGEIPTLHRGKPLLFSNSQIRGWIASGMRYNRVDEDIDKRLTQKRKTK